MPKISAVTATFFISFSDSWQDVILWWIFVYASKPITRRFIISVFRKAVSHTSLSRANESRDYRIFEGLGLYLICHVRPMYSNIQLSQITIDNVIYALDSTTISTSIKLATWALGKYSKGAVKMHTLLDWEATYLPISISRTASGMTATNLTLWHRSLMLLRDG